MGSNRNTEPLWPAVPSRITVEDPPLLAQVSELMEHAKPMQTLRHSGVRDRVIAGVARRKTTQREQEHNIGRKRGRRWGIDNNALEHAYSPAGVAGNSMGPGDGNSCERLRSGGQRQSLVWNGSANIDRSDLASRLNDGGIVGRSRGGKVNGLRQRRRLPGTRSEQTISTLQPPGLDMPFASQGGFGLDLRDNSISSSSWTTRSPQEKRHPRQQRNICLAVPSRSSRRMPRVVPTSTSLYTTDDRSHGGNRGGAPPSTLVSSASSSSPPDDAKSSGQLPGVCYITYPPTPDLTATVVPASSDFSLECGLQNGDGGGGGDGADEGSMSVTRERTRGASAELSQPKEKERSAAAEAALTSGSPREDPSFRGVQVRSYCGPVDENGVDGEERHHSLEQPSPVEGSHGQASSSTTDPPGTKTDLAHGAELEAGNSQQNQLQQNPRADDERGGDNLQHRVSVSVGGGGDAGGPAGREARRRRRQRKGRGRQGMLFGRAINTNIVRVKTAPTGHPLGGSRVFPTLPGVDEHQRPVFWLAEMHENLRKNRAALNTPFRHRVLQSRPPAPTLEDEANAFDDLGSDGRTRMDTEIETELSMVVRYFMRFGAKGGREGLTLQDLEAAFRASRRADAFVAIEKKGKAAFGKCLKMLEAHGLTPEAWLEELLSKRKGDSLTTFDMGESIRAYNRAKPSWVRSHKHWLHGFMISEKDLRWCQRFVDPDGNTDVDAEEFFNAVRSTLDGKPRISFEESRAVELIMEFERFMAINRIRLVDLFEKVDKDKGGTIDENELREFLMLGRKTTASGGDMTRAKERKVKMEEEAREKSRTEFLRKVTEAKKRHARSRDTGVYGLLVSLKGFTRTTGLRLVDMIQATGAHPEEGMDPSQLQTFFERATNSSLRLTKESLEKIVKYVDEDGDGLLSLSEIQLALTQHTQDELLLRRLAKAVAQHVAGQDKVDLNSKKAHDPGRQPPGSFASGLGSSIRSSGGRSAAGGGGSGCRGTDGNSDRNKSRISPQRGDSDSRSLGVSTSSTNVGHSFRWKRGGGNDDGESSELTMPENSCGVSAMPESALSGNGAIDAAGRTSQSKPRNRDGSVIASPAAIEGASSNADDNYHWILDDESSLGGIASMEGVELSASATRERRAACHMSSSFVPRTAFKVQAGSNLDSSWLPGFDQRFECQRQAQAQRVMGGACTWYTN